MSNVIVEVKKAVDGTPGSVETANNSPAVETVNARFEQLGPFLQSNPAASQSATAMLLVGNADQSNMVAARAGTIVGIAARSNANLTAGTATFASTVGGTAVGSTAVLDGANGPVRQVIATFATPVAFAQGDLLAITLATSSGYLPVTADHQAWLLIRWAA